MVFRFTATLAGLLTLLAPIVRADDDLKLRTEDIAVTARAAQQVPEAKGRKVLHEARKAFAAIANRLSVTSREVFRTDGRLPAWYPPEARDLREITIVLTRGATGRPTSSSTYLSGLAKGRAEIGLAVSDEKRVTVEETHLLWRGVAIAVLTHLLGEGGAQWLREGLADALAEEACDGEGTGFGGLRTDLSGSRPAMADALATWDAGRFGRLGARAGSWALVRLLLVANPDLLLALVRQSRYLADRVTLVPSRDALRKEHTAALLGQLTASGADVKGLDSAVAAWVAQGFPGGTVVRSGREFAPVRRLRVPLPHRVDLRGNWGRSYLTETGVQGVDMTDNHPLRSARISWRLPFMSHMEAFAGVRDSVRRNSARQEPLPESYVLSVATWGADPSGSRVLDKITIASPAGRKKRRFLMLAVSSPLGLGYTFFAEVEPR